MLAAAAAEQEARAAPRAAPYSDQTATTFVQDWTKDSLNWRCRGAGCARVCQGLHTRVLPHSAAHAGQERVNNGGDDWRLVCTPVSYWLLYSRLLEVIGKSLPICLRQP